MSDEIETITESEWMRRKFAEIERRLDAIEGGDHVRIVQQPDGRLKGGVKKFYPYITNLAIDRFAHCPARYNNNEHGLKAI